MREPFPSEGYITIIDNRGRERVQRVEYIVLDVRGEKVHVTADGLAYAEDSLAAKEQSYLIGRLGKLSGILAHPDIVIWDPVEAPGDTLIYYKWVYIAALRRRKLVAAIVKTRRGVKFFYNLHVQESVRSRGFPLSCHRRYRSGTSRLGSSGASSACRDSERIFMRKLRFLFQEPGLIEAVASDPDVPMSEAGLDTPGYRSLWVADLMVDYDPRTGMPYAFMSSSFEKTYPLVIWALKFHIGEELFDVPQASLTAVPLHEAFSWAYAHFILEDQLPIPQPEGLSEPRSLTRQVLRYAAAAA